MKQTICAVRDSAIDGYLQPMYVQKSQQAVRAFTKEVNNPQSPMYDTPDDYSLYEIGEFDSDTGATTSITPIRLIRGKDCKHETTQPQRTE